MYTLVPDWGWNSGGLRLADARDKRVEKHGSFLKSHPTRIVFVFFHLGKGVSRCVCFVISTWGIEDMRFETS